MPQCDIEKVTEKKGLRHYETVVIDGKTVVFKAEKSRDRKTQGKPISAGDTVDRIDTIRRVYRYTCGSYRAELIRQTIDFLCSSRTQPLPSLTPLRTRYTHEERNTPRLLPDSLGRTLVRRRCTDSVPGEFTLTRTVTGICSGWRWLSGRLNKAPTGAPEALKSTGVSGPFKIVGFHSDTGSESIYRHTINGRETVKTLGLSFSRSSHKNGPCLQTAGPT